MTLVIAIHELLLGLLLGLVGVRVTSAVRRREPLRAVVDGALFPGFFVFMLLARISPRWFIPCFVGMVVVLLRMIWIFIQSKRAK
jgi:hypothetical protein